MGSPADLTPSAFMELLVIMTCLLTHLADCLLRHQLRPNSCPLLVVGRMTDPLTATIRNQINEK